MTQPGPPRILLGPVQGPLGQPASGLCLDESSGLRRPGRAGARPSFGRKALALVRRTGHGPYSVSFRFLFRHEVAVFLAERQ
jgi:hypothetical protein